MRHQSVIHKKLEVVVLEDILNKYGNLLREVDGWFENCLMAHSDQIACHSGCSSCCRGLFDITLLDALYLQSGYAKLTEGLKGIIRKKADDRLKALSASFPSLHTPWILNVVPESDWDEIMPEEDETPCVILSDDGDCLVYQYRPMTCRLNGIPMIDVTGEELFDEWCSLNFQDKDPLLLAELRFNFNDLFAQELLLFRELTRRILGESVNEIDTLIPAAVNIDIEAVVSLLNKLKS